MFNFNFSFQLGVTPTVRRTSGSRTGRGAAQPLATGGSRAGVGFGGGSRLAVGSHLAAHARTSSIKRAGSSGGGGDDAIGDGQEADHRDGSSRGGGADVDRAAARQ